MAKGDWKKTYAGKGDSPRPVLVDQETFAQNWERTFGKGRLQKYADAQCDICGGICKEGP